MNACLRTSLIVCTVAATHSGCSSPPNHGPDTLHSERLVRSHPSVSFVHVFTFSTLYKGILDPADREHSKHYDPVARDVEKGPHIQVCDMSGKVLWLRASDFQTKVLPKPPQHLMPSDDELQDIRDAFSDLAENYRTRASKDGKHKGPKYVLAEGFVSLFIICLFLEFPARVMMRSGSRSEYSWSDCPSGCSNVF